MMNLLSGKNVKVSKIPTLLIIFFILNACGGGGGGGDACSTLRVAGGDSCNPSGNVALVLGYNSQGNIISQCTGSYISLTSVLTAAHCFLGSPSSVQILSSGHITSAVSLAIHPLYNLSVDSPFDMAILKVDTPLSVAPLPLLFSKNPVEGEQVVAYGYGLDENNQASLDRLVNGEKPLKATYTTYVGYSSGTSAIVSTGEGSTCQGDSGGPVVAKNAKGEYGIIGITRSGPQGCNASKGRPSFLSSTESRGAIDFIAKNAPDAAVN